jgi:hypothetical protein
MVIPFLRRESRRTALLGRPVTPKLDVEGAAPAMTTDLDARALAMSDEAVDDEDVECEEGQ